MKNSIRTQIIVAVVTSQMLLAILLTVGIVLYSRSKLLADFDVMLEGRADSVFSEIDDSKELAEGLRFDSEKLRIPSDDLVELWDDRGNLVFRTKNWSVAPASFLTSHPSDFKFKSGSWLYRGIVVRKTVVFDADGSHPASTKEVMIVYAAPTNRMNQRILEIIIFAAGVSLFSLLLTGLFAAYGVNWGLSPLRQLAVEAARVSIHSWTFNPPEAARTKTELTPLVNALEATLAGLERAFTREREFMADATHELKTAVAILKSSLQLLLLQPRSSEEYRTGVECSLEDCERIEALVYNTLNLARAEQRLDGDAADGRDWVDLASTCEQAVADLHSLAKSHSVDLVCGADTQARVKADPFELRILWVNLLQNAIQHSPRGSTVSVNVTAQNPESVTVIVEDQGTGIPTEHLPRVFDRFYRSDPSRNRDTGGAGLGLAICQKLVQAYGGHIQIDSSIDAGTRVSVTLPAMSTDATLEKTFQILSHP